MVYTTILTTSGQCVLKAGPNIASSTLFSGAAADANWGRLITEAEGVVCVMTRYDWLTNYASLTSGAKLIIGDLVSNLATINAIQSDLDVYTSRVDAEDKINVSYINPTTTNLTYTLFDRLITLERNQTQVYVFNWPPEMVDVLVYWLQQVDPTIPYSFNDLSGESLVYDVKIVKIIKTNQLES